MKIRKFISNKGYRISKNKITISYIVKNLLADT